jgi:hypothetical protein
MSETEDDSCSYESVSVTTGSVPSSSLSQSDNDDAAEVCLESPVRQVADKKLSHPASQPLSQPVSK